MGGTSRRRPLSSSSSSSSSSRMKRKSSSHGGGGGGGRDFFVEVEDVDGVHRKVHVFDGGPYLPPPVEQPPLVMIGGTAQVISSWVGHINQLAKERRLIVIEARGQGKTELSLEAASIEQHVIDYTRIMSALGLGDGDGDGAVDLCGFSFGGRVAMAVAATHSHRVRKLVATGVPAERDAMARLILRSWKEALERGHMHDFAWNSMLQCHGRAFLTQYESKIPEWINFVIKGNRPEAILSIITKSHTTDVTDPYHTINLAKRIACPTLLICGAEDRVAPLTEVKRLAAAVKEEWPVVVMEGAGHNCVFESPAEWREAVLSFLASPP